MEDATQEITGEQVWKALQGDHWFRGHITHEEARAVFRGECLRLPSVLADELRQPLTIVTLARAQAKVLTDQDKSGFTLRLFRSYPEEMFRGAKEQVIAQAVARERQELPVVQRFAKNASEWLDQFMTRTCMSEAEVLASPLNGRLEAPAMELYRQGKLTIGKLLVMQPLALMRPIGTRMA